MSQIQEVKQATDIVQLIGGRISLNRSGANFRGLCPFHSEKSPSFFVNERLQRYKCFGCGEAGDVFTFLEKYEGMTFGEALQALADAAGITLEKTSFTPEDDQRKRILEILDLSKEYFRYLLHEHKVGENALAYLKNRGTTSESLKIFQIGYALNSWDGLLKYLHDKKKYSLTDIEAAGMVVRGKNGQLYDRFRDRVMFPLTNHRGQVVGFSGRVLDAAAKEAKYINTPETMVYHKGQMLYGYSQLYQSLRKENEAVVVEGEFDVISSAQAHVNHVVAVKGSALTEDHMKLLSRTVQRVILSFDMDGAGLAATKRAVEVARPFELEVRVINFASLGDGHEKKDPDDLARTQPQLWRQLVKSSISVYDFFIDAAIKKHGAGTPEGKRKIIDELAPVFENITHAVELEHYIGKLAKVLEVKEAIVRSDIEKFKGIKKKGLTKVASPRAAAVEESKKTQTPVKETRKSKIETYVLFLLFNLPEEKIPAAAEKLKHITFSKSGTKQIVAQLAQVSSQPASQLSASQSLASPTPFSLAEFAKKLGEDLQQTLLELSMNSEYLAMLPNLDLEKEWAKSMPELVNLDIAEEIDQVTHELEALENKNDKTAEDEEKMTQLLRKIVQLRAQQRKK